MEKSFEYPPLAATGHSQDIVGPDSSHSGTSVWGGRERERDGHSDTDRHEHVRHIRLQQGGPLAHIWTQLWSLKLFIGILSLLLIHNEKSHFRT